MSSQPATRKSIKRDQAVFLWAVGLSLVLYFVPFGFLIGAPIFFLNTILHEICHAVAAILTGGEVGHIMIFSNGSGLASVSGGSMLIVGSAGYVGAALIGAVCIVCSVNEKNSRVVLASLAVLLTLALLLWIRGEVIGVLITIAWIVSLALGAWFLRGTALIFFAQFVGVQQCLSSITSVNELVPIAMHTEVQNDAQILQDATGVPALFFALSWLLMALAFGYLALALVWKLPPFRRRAAR